MGHASIFAARETDLALLTYRSENKLVEFVDSGQIHRKDSKKKPGHCNFDNLMIVIKIK